MTRWYRRVVFGMVLCLFAGYPAGAQNYAPAVDQLSLMGMRYYAQSGGFLVEGVQLVFPPAEAPEGELTVTNAAGEIVASVPLQVRLWNDWPAFGVLKPVGPGSVQLNAPGDYTLAVRLGDAVIGELKYTLTAEGGDDPFNPQQTYVRFTLADLQSQDGSYALTLLADGKPVKTYAVTVSGGQVQPSPRSALSSEPRPDFLTPRRINTSSGSGSRYFMEEVFWISAGN